VLDWNVMYWLDAGVMTICGPVDHASTFRRIQRAVLSAAGLAETAPGAIAPDLATIPAVLGEMVCFDLDHWRDALVMAGPEVRDVRALGGIVEGPLAAAGIAAAAELVADARTHAGNPAVVPTVQHRQNRSFFWVSEGIVLFVGVHERKIRLSSVRGSILQTAQVRQRRIWRAEAEAQGAQKKRASESQECP